MLQFFFIFFVTWWILLFAVLPWGVRVAEKAEEGHASSAPIQPKLKQKAIANTILSALIAGILTYALNAGWIDFRLEEAPF